MYGIHTIKTAMIRLALAALLSMLVASQALAGGDRRLGSCTMAEPPARGPSSLPLEQGAGVCPVPGEAHGVEASHRLFDEALVTPRRSQCSQCERLEIGAGSHKWDGVALDRLPPPERGKGIEPRGNR